MKVFIWTTFVDKLYRNEGNPGGLAIQMSYWAQIFAQKGWKVYSLSEKKQKEYNNVSFLKFPNIRYIGILIEFIMSFYYIVVKSPQVIIARGASRNTFYLSLWTRLVNAKLVFFGASNSDFIIGEELINAERDKRLYRKGIKRINYVVAQNEQQKKLVLKNYGDKECIIIPNIWPTNNNDTNDKDIDFLWVSNFRELKHPDWFIKLAKDNPLYKFTMVGGRYDKGLYEACEKEATNIPNLKFLGSKPFNEVNEIFTHARCFVCTSTMEGFPNTFLQAWSNNIPVLSTFAPSDIIQKHNLGTLVTEYEEMNENIPQIIDSKNYNEKQKAIKKYFADAHSPENMYDKLMQMLDIRQ